MQPPASPSTPSTARSASSATRSDSATAPPAAATDAVEAFAERAGVELIDWPADDQRRRTLARAGVPRLLIVASAADTPDTVGTDEDWVRLPVDTGDVLTRLERLALLVERFQHDRPVLDDANIVHHAGTSVLLSPSQAKVAAVLLERRGEVAARTELEATLWPAGAPGPKALDGIVFRLRGRLAGLGIVVRSVHARGFAIDVPDPAAGTPAQRPTAM